MLDLLEIEDKPVLSSILKNIEALNEKLIEEISTSQKYQILAQHSKNINFSIGNYLNSVQKSRICDGIDLNYDLLEVLGGAICRSFCSMIEIYHFNGVNDHLNELRSRINKIYKYEDLDWKNQISEVSDLDYGLIQRKLKHRNDLDLFSLKILLAIGGLLHAKYGMVKDNSEFEINELGTVLRSIQQMAFSTFINKNSKFVLTLLAYFYSNQYQNDYWIRSCLESRYAMNSQGIDFVRLQLICFALKKVGKVEAKKVDLDEFAQSIPGYVRDSISNKIAELSYEEYCEIAGNSLSSDEFDFIVKSFTEVLSIEYEANLSSVE